MLYATLLCIPQVTNGDPTPTPPAVGTLCVPTVVDPAVVWGVPFPIFGRGKENGIPRRLPPLSTSPLVLFLLLSLPLSHRRPPLPPKTATGSRTSLPPRRPLPPFRHPQRPLGGYKGDGGRSPLSQLLFIPYLSPTKPSGISGFQGRLFGLVSAAAVRDDRGFSALGFEWKKCLRRKQETGSPSLN